MPTIYVTTSGNDTTGTGTEANPYLTISKAHAAASGGDTIIINDNGTYNVVEGGANQVTTTPSSLKTDLNFKAGEGFSPVLDGGSSATYAFKCWHDWIIEGLTFRNFVDSSGGTGTGVIKQYYNHNTGQVYDCVFHNITGAAINLQGAGTIAERNTIYDAYSFTGIYLGTAVDNAARNNIIYNTAGRAIFASQGIVEHNTIYNTPREVDFHSTRTYAIHSKYIRYNIVEAANVTIAGVRALGTGAETRYNCVTGTYDSGGSSRYNYYNNVLGTGDIESSPQFTDKDNGDFTLPISSPCFQGAHTSSVAFDKQKFNRTWQYDDGVFSHNTSTNSEMGALEVHSARIMGVHTSDISKVLGNAG